MAWAKIDDQFFDHPKSRAAGKDGRALYFAGLCYCGKWRTNGRIAKSVLGLVAAMAEVRPKTAGRLIEAGLWHEEGDDFIVHDYLDWNPSSEEVEDRRAKRAAAGKRGGKQSGKVRGSKKGSKPEATGEAKPEASASPNGKQKRTPSPSPSLEPLAPKGARSQPATHKALYGALIEVFGDVSTSVAKSFYGKCARELREAGATPDEVVARGRFLLTKNWTDSGAGALVKHWDRLVPPPDRRPLVGGLPVDMKG